MWNRLLNRMLSDLLVVGDLHLTLPDGTTRTYGDGSGGRVAATLHDPGLPRQIVLKPDLAVGEAYMDQRLTIEDDNLYGLLDIATRNIGAGRQVWWQRIVDRIRITLRQVEQFNPVGKAKENVAHHYDLSGALYDLFLDPDKQYSCAYFRHPEASLEEAQAAKKAHIGAKLCIEPGMRVLDIGCGWGGMGLTLARDYGAQVLGVTLSEEQHAIAEARAAEAGLADQVEFRLTDYRDVDETFDRIVSVGMFEHVGVPHYREYFRHVHDKLTEDGIALIHTIGRTSPPGSTSPWIDKYIFPGGYIPSLSETMAAVELEHLRSADIEVWRLHYAETLRHWYNRFVANEDRAREIYDDRFCRMWRYYLIASELSFRNDAHVVFQLQLARKRDAVPLTRDYLYRPEFERMSHAAE